MKRTSKKWLAFVVTLAMVMSLLPGAAMAVDTNTYKLTVTIEDDADNKVTGRLSSLVATEKLVFTIAQIVLADYSELEEFGSRAMKELMDEGLVIGRNASVDADLQEIWSDYINATPGLGTATGTLRDHISNLSNQITVLTPGETYKMEFTNDAALDEYYGTKYTISVKLEVVTSGGTVTRPVVPETPVVVQPSANGGAAVKPSKTDKVTAGQQAIIQLDPDDGYRTNRVVVTDKNGNPVSLTALDNDTYTFIVPEGGVTVSTNFILMPTPVEKTGVTRMLNGDADLAYIQGKADGKFHPADNITRGQVATIFYRLLKEEYANVTHTKSFEDVPEDFWCVDAINTLATLGIVNGMTTEEFAPNKAITRAQFVAICARFAETVAKGEEFRDVPENYWAYDYISTASGHGWINGVGDGLFEPNAPITRAQAVTIVNRMLCRIADRATIDALEEQFYHDVHDTHWAWYDIGEASQGVLSRED